MTVLAAGPACRGKERAGPASLGDSVRVAEPLGPVTIRGLVVETGTGRAVPGAVIIVLQAGVTSQEWISTRGEEATEALMEGTALTDSTGAYEIPALARGGAYTVMVTAAGYTPAIFEGGLEIRAEDPPVTVMRPVELEAR